ncbi:migration and invasion inhibitory protein [Centroberyx gerrardi]|uniref:migration and invasion-inhibitory protein n=1 Tax=Centroberyx gerrardi TaxID=166262 RepID=UPI003AB0919E
MSDADRLSVLRERNKDLLMQLRQQRDRLQHLNCAQSHERESEDGAEEIGKPAEVLTLTDGDRGPARAALAKPTVSYADTCRRQTGMQCTVSTPSLTSKHRQGTADHTVSSEVFKFSLRRPAVHVRPQDTRGPGTKSSLQDRGQKQREVGSRVTFQSDEWKEMSASDRHHLQPLLGYDWIAGVLDVESCLAERSEDFFNDLRTFRSVNKDECVHSQQAGFPEENHSVPALLADKDGPEANMDTHQCTFSYRINSRLFPVPLHSQECCPVCKKPKSTHPHTTAEPAFIRVSIPRSTLLPSYKYKAHRRCSFDPSDSLGLPSHCLSGWSNTGQSSQPQPSSLDLRSSVNNMKTCAELPWAQSHNKEQDLSVTRVSGHQRPDQIFNVSRLARHRFQHFSPKGKLGITSYPVY